MNHRERFSALMNYRSFDRMPVYFFGTWPETLARWRSEGLDDDVEAGRFVWSQVGGLDPDWETSPDGKHTMWYNHGIINCWPVSGVTNVIVEETDRYRIQRTSLGGLVKSSKVGSSIPQHLEPDLSPTREDWKRFRKFLDADDPQRWFNGWEERAELLKKRDCVACFFGGSLYGWLRDWMGVEAISCLPYDDPALFEEMIEHMADFFLATNRRLLKHAQFDFAYFFEDCCFNTGPLLSPSIFQKFFARHYSRMTAAYRDMGVPLMLMDSDGKVDALISGWLDSGFDIVLPLEVGTWKADPVALRRQYGKRLRIFGGVNKLVIPRGEAAIRAELEPLKPLAAEGGFIPVPDHRIPPDCSLEQFRTYVRVFNEVFNSH